MDTSRRDLLRAVLAVGAGLRPLSGLAQAAPGPLLTRPVPATGEALPVIGLGSWITFNVGDDPVARDGCAEVMRNFFARGGRLIDSSPMYGSAQAVIGYGLRQPELAQRVFAADKVWISQGSKGPAQIEESRRLWNVRRFDLLQVHNLLAREEHLPTLFALKAAGRLRHVGITTSEGRRHGEFEKIVRSQPLDFIQLSYNIRDREADCSSSTTCRSGRRTWPVWRCSPRTTESESAAGGPGRRPTRSAPRQAWR